MLLSIPASNTSKNFEFCSRSLITSLVWFLDWNYVPKYFTVSHCKDNEVSLLWVVKYWLMDVALNLTVRNVKRLVDNAVYQFPAHLKPDFHHRLARHPMQSKSYKWITTNFGKQYNVHNLLWSLSIFRTETNIFLYQVLHFDVYKIHG